MKPPAQFKDFFPQKIENKKIVFFLPAGPKIREMWEQEKEHLATFNRYIPEYRVRPTALLPLWHVAGYALGAG